jgi:hypothetical protein
MASRVRTARLRELQRHKMVRLRDWEQDEHDDPPLPATTSNTRRSVPVPKYEDRHSEPEPTSDSKPSGHVKDDQSPGGDREHHGIGETEFNRRKRYLEIKTFLSELPDSPFHYSGLFGSRPARQ